MRSFDGHLMGARPMPSHLEEEVRGLGEQERAKKGPDLPREEEGHRRVPRLLYLGGGAVRDKEAKLRAADTDPDGKANSDDVDNGEEDK